MAETTLSTPRPTPRRERDTNEARPLRRRRSLPGGRAVVGGFLVALAAVGVFAAYTSATADTRQAYLVARHDLALGHRITRADLGTLPMDLPSILRARVYRNPSRLLGALVIGPVAKGELVQSSDVLSGDQGPSDRQISFPIESARAVDGQLRRGEFVDVVATFGTGGDSFTAAVVRGARVADRSVTRGSLSDRGTEVITLTVPSADDTLAVAHAVSTGTVMLERVPGPSEPGETGVPGDVPTYRPGSAPAADSGVTPPAPAAAG